MATPRRSGPKPASSKESFPSHHSIAVRAYGLFVQRGSTHGWDLDDWLEAERELRGENNDKAPKQRKPKAVKSVA